MRIHILLLLLFLLYVRRSPSVSERAICSGEPENDIFVVAARVTGATRSEKKINK